MTWDLIEILETWHDVRYGGILKEHSAKQKLSYDEVKRKLLVEHE